MNETQPPHPNLMMRMLQEDQANAQLPTLWEVSFLTINDTLGAGEQVEDFMDVSGTADGQSAIEKVRAHVLSKAYMGKDLPAPTKFILKGLKQLAAAEL